MLEFCELLAPRLREWSGERVLKGDAAVLEVAVWCGLRLVADYQPSDPFARELVAGLRSLVDGQEWSAPFRIEWRRAVIETGGAKIDGVDTRTTTFSFSNRCVYNDAEAQAKLAPSVEAEPSDPYERILRELLFDAVAVALAPESKRLGNLAFRGISLLASFHDLDAAVDYLVEFDDQMREAITNEMIHGVSPPSLSALADSAEAGEEFLPLLSSDSRPFSKLPSPPDWTFHHGG